MPTAIPPYPATVNSARANNRWLADQLFANPESDILGRSPANGASCTSCGRTPRWGELCKVVIDPASNLTAAIGIGRCHHDFLRASLEYLLRHEQARNDPNQAENMDRLQRVIAKLPVTLP